MNCHTSNMTIRNFAGKLIRKTHTQTEKETEAIFYHLWSVCAFGCLLKKIGRRWGPTNDNGFC